MKKLVYADTKGLELAKLGKGFIVTEEAFMTYRHPVLVNDYDIEEGESVTKSIVVYNVHGKADVIVMKDEKVLYVKDLAKVMDSRTRTQIVVLNDDNDSFGGSLGYFVGTKQEGMMIISNMKFVDGELVIRVFETEVA